MYPKVLVAVDLSHGAVVARIIAVARRLAGPDGQITLLSVMESIPGYVASALPAETLAAGRADARVQLEALAAAHLPGARIALREGKPSAEILAEAEDHGADVIVLGSHRPDLGDYLLGSTAARVVRHASCAVLVAR